VLAPPVHRRLGRVQIEGHILARVATELTVKLVPRARHATLDRADVAKAKPVGQLARGRRRRGLGHRPQARARPIGTHVLDAIEALRADQLRLSDRDRQLPRREPPTARLDRRRPLDRRKLGVDQLHQPQIARQLARDRQPRVRRQRRIIRAELDPSGASGRVNHHHPPGEFHSHILGGLIHPPP
jgi:hypothetical protein